MNEMNETYRQILQIVTQFCNDKPHQGFEVTYLSDAQTVLDLYQDAKANVDKYEKENPEVMEKNLKSILENLKKIVI